uniref:Uncharacterized protein n=1 Tax=Oryza punctata TaxID=4537 RepID=A0A0E0KHN4_ORYPU
MHRISRRRVPIFGSATAALPTTKLRPSQPSPSSDPLLPPSPPPDPPSPSPSRLPPLEPTIIIIAGVPEDDGSDSPEDDVAGSVTRHAGRVQRASTDG